MHVHNLGTKYHFNHNTADFKESDIVSINWTEDYGIQITISTWKNLEHTAQINYQFYEFYGLRYLDEGDLLRYVTNSNFHDGYHLYEILDGGWNSGEIKSEGILDMSAIRKELREFFILTTNGCISILSINNPEINEINI